MPRSRLRTARVKRDGPSKKLRSNNIPAHVLTGMRGFGAQDLGRSGALWAFGHLVKTIGIK